MPLTFPCFGVKFLDDPVSLSLSWLVVWSLFLFLMWQFLVLCQQTNKICRTHSWLILQCAHKTCKRFGHLYGRYHGQPVEARQQVVKMLKNMAYVFYPVFQGYSI